MDNVKVSMNQLFDYFKVTANFEFSPVCVGQTANFIDLSTGTNNESLYYWDIYNDGIVDYTTTGSISHNFSSAGEFPIKLKIVNGVNPQHQSEIIKYITVNELPETTIILKNSELCLRETTILQGIPNGGNFSGEGVINNTFNSTNLSPGQYNIYYSFTDTNGCTSSTSETINVIDCTKIEKTLLETSVVIYSDQNILEIINLTKKSKITIMDVYGRLMISKISTYVSENIDISQLKNGIYFLNIITDSFNISKRIVIFK